MKSLIYTIAIFCTGLILAPSAFADLKIKSKQSMAGQSYENTTYIKGKRQRTESMGGAMVNITQCDLRRNIQLNPAAQTYMVNPFMDAEPAVQTRTSRTAAEPVTRGGTINTTVTIKDTGERKQMFGYTARHLIMTMETESTPDACSKTKTKMQTDGWYIDFEANFGCDHAYSSGYDPAPVKAGGCRDKYNMKTIGTAKRGYPVYEKMTMFDESGKETFSTVSEVVELSKATLDAGLFDIPADYREVDDAASLYTAGNFNDAAIGSRSKPTLTVPSNAGPSNTASSTIAGAKKEGTLRIGIPAVKIGAVADGISAADLSNAIADTLMAYLKVPNLEVILLEGRLASAIDAEAVQKECDFVLLATATHKKGGGGGFGAFSKVIAPAIGATGLGNTGSTAGNIAAGVATRGIVTAGQIAGNVKAKDEISIDIKLNRVGGTSVYGKSFKKKAKSDGDDIISAMIEEAAQGIVTAIGR